LFDPPLAVLIRVDTGVQCAEGEVGQHEEGILVEDGWAEREGDTFLAGLGRRLFYVERSWARRGFDLFLVGEPRGAGGARSYLSSLVMVPIQDDAGLTLPRAPITLTEAEAQHLMDELWRAGLRPSEGSGSAGALAATQAHLDDMRRLVFEMVVGSPVPKPGARGE
jgi:hypothetical protein